MGRWFLPFYLAGGVAANALDMLLRAHSRVPGIGASGAICAVIAAYIVFFPGARMRCYAFFVVRFVQYNLSALLFGIIYIGAQFYGLRNGRDGVAYGAHIGGLGFGLAVAMLWPGGREAFRGAEADAPGRMTAAGQEILALLRQGREETAVQKFIEAARKDRSLEFPDDMQLAIANKLVEYGYPQLAKWALEKILRHYPDSASAPSAYLLLGRVEQDDNRDFVAALRAYRKAAAHPAATPERRKDAQARAQKIEGGLRKILVYPAQDGDRFSVILESVAALTESERQSIAAATGEPPPGRMPWETAFLLENADKDRALTLASSLEEAGVPVLIVPNGMLLGLPSMQIHERMQADIGGITFSGGAGDALVPWKNCLLVVAAAAPVGDPKKKRAGLLEIEVESVTGVGLSGVEASLPNAAAYENESEPTLCFEAVTLQPYARHRWIVPQKIADPLEAANVFYDALQAVSLNALNVPFNEGIQTVFSRRLPDTCVFNHMAQFNAYLSWQLQLARLKKARA
jgi:hypothetical protein